MGTIERDRQSPSQPIPAPIVTASPSPSATTPESDKSQRCLPNNRPAALWKLELQKLADEADMSITVCHYPPGTSKWNKIEHRLFSHIAQTWRARPLTVPSGRS
jgi:hypothetical protein